jgi:hypothetical protein
LPSDLSKPFLSRVPGSPPGGGNPRGRDRSAGRAASDPREASENPVDDRARPDWIENRFKRFLIEAGLPAPICQHRIDLGAGYGGTIPDFFYAVEGDDDEEPGICIYLDGMADHIHGNPEQSEKDRAQRDKLDNLGYEVVVVRSFELDDKSAVVRAIARIAKYLVGREKQRAVRSDTSWFDRVDDVETRSDSGSI